MLSARKKNKLIEQVEKLPPLEIKYYLFLLIQTLDKTDKPFPPEVIAKLNDFTLELANIFNQSNPEGLHNRLNTLTASYQALVNAAKTNGLLTKIGYFLLNIGGGISALLLGVIGAVSGCAVGFIRSLWKCRNPLKGFIVGLVTGYMVGAAIGFRLPKKLCKNELNRQLSFCLNHINECLQNIDQQHDFAAAKKEVEEAILRNFFNNDKEAYDNFLTEKHDYKITNVHAQFISPTLERYLGHHMLLELSINYRQKLIEFSSEATDLAARTTTQFESRRVTGNKIIDMLAFDALLKKTHAFGFHYLMTKMKPGDNYDCFSYVNTILIGTDQAPTNLKRFEPMHKFSCQKAVGFFISSLNPFPPDFLQAKTENATDLAP